MLAAVTDAVVPVAGLGTRLAPLTRALPKELLPVGRTPVVGHVVEELAAAGVERVCFVTRRGKGAILDHFDDPDPGHAISFLAVRQAVQRGLGDAVLCAEGTVTGPFVVALGDAVLSAAGGAPAGIVARLGAAFAAHDAVAAIAVEAVPPEAISRYGVVAPRAEAAGGVLLLEDLVEKPDPADAPSRWAIAARYVLSPAIFGALRTTAPGTGGEVQLTDAIRALLHAGGTVVAVPLAPGERRHDVGSPASYARAFLDLALDDPELGPELRAHLVARLRDGG
ncbi:MAG: UTP--glucose-phosphate uridylyltransferase [Solirubrobacterales bacterium]|nr:UTP--glucose-phosphate uridylyltransferase [Solirubrobacterales bacterium]